MIADLPAARDGSSPAGVDAPLRADLLYGRLLATAVASGIAPPARVRAADGTCRPLPLEQWLAPVDAADLALLVLAEPPVLDLGCGPGRHLAALREAGKAALGIDLSPVAVRLARGRGLAAFPGDVFAGIPGRWRTVLLLDGNVGIGGAPGLLLRRVRELLAPGGAALVELDPPGSPTYRTRVRIEAHGEVSEWFRWARVGVDGVDRIAARVGLTAGEPFQAGDRWFARLERP